MGIIDSVFVIAVIMFSAVIHEVAHGVAADKLGDPTARYAGRLTLNPIKHLDPIGSVILPVILALTSSPILFGWAKPVPYNPYNLTKNPRYGEAIVAGAGPASNFLIAAIAASIVRLGVFSSEINSVLFIIILANIMLGIFNLIPIPPLDGSKVLTAVIPANMQHRYHEWRMRLEYNPLLGMGLVLVLILALGGAFGSFVYSIARAVAGI